MSPAIARIITLHSTRAALIASWKGAVRLGAELQPASLAGRALEQHDDVEAALDSIRALRKEMRIGREDMPLSEGEWDLVGASVYLRQVRAEERGQPSEAPVRYRPSISDEDDQ